MAFVLKFGSTGDEVKALTAFGVIPAVCIMDAGINGVLILAD